MSRAPGCGSRADNRGLPTMERRKFIIGAGALATGSAAAVGTGAFSSAVAERTVTIETAGDDDSLLGFSENENFDGDQGKYVGTTDIDTLELTLEDIPRDAVMQFDDLIEVTNRGSQDITLFVNVDAGEPDEDPIWGNGYDNDGPLDILYGSDYDSDADGQGDSDSIVGGNTNQLPNNDPPVLGSGDSATLTVVVDTRGFGDDDWKDGKVVFEAV